MSDTSNLNPVIAVKIAGAINAETSVPVTKKVMDLDFSWEASAKAYIKVYDELLELI